MDNSSSIKGDKNADNDENTHVESSSSELQEQSELNKFITKPEFTLEEILINLSLISKIENGNKLVITDKYINIDTSYFNFVTRWLFGSSRMNTMEFIREMLNQSFLHGIKLLQEDTETSNQLLMRLNSELKNSINGLTSLKQTYYMDKAIQAKIDVMIENIRDQLELKLKNFRNQKQQLETRDSNVFSEKEIYNQNNENITTLLEENIQRKESRIDKKKKKKKRSSFKSDISISTPAVSPK